MRTRLLVATSALIAALAFSAIAAAQLDGPPPMRLTVKGKTVVATQGSTCWTFQDGSSVCADSRYPLPVRCTLPVKKGAKLVIDFGAPVSQAGASAVRADARKQAALPEWKGGNADGQQVWRFRLTKLATRYAAISAFARYDQGDSNTWAGVATDSCRDAHFPKP